MDPADMQKIIFNTFSDQQWAISPPSMKTFIKDFKNISKGKSDDTKVINFRTEWNFVRKFPVGKEKSSGK
jgi:hypothetical protein